MSRIPPQIGKYKIVSLIAEGGMGAVYKAEHPTLNRYVALKRLVMRGSTAFAERFRREARIMMDFKNDRIVVVYDHFKEKSSYYIVEEYVDGTSLDRLIRRERYLPNEVALLIFLECCRALKYAHDQGVVHRDIKPANILISRSGKVKLSDFGIAISKESDEETLTRDGMTLGTLPYIAPEQIRNSRGVDKRADIYAMGAMLYEMTTGRSPYPRTFTPETIHLIQKGRYLAPARLNPRVSPAVRRIIQRAMKVNPRRRYQDLGEVIRFLEWHFRGWKPEEIRETIQRFVSRQERAARRRRGRRLLQWVLVGLAAAGVLVGAAAWLLVERGYWYELFRARDYGALEVAARVRKGVKEPERLFVRADLFREEGGGLAAVQGADFRFAANPRRETPDFHLLESRRLYLPGGEYRIKVRLENELYWESFTLLPREAQRRQPAGAEAQRIEVPPLSWPGLPVAVRFEVVDRATGEDLSASTDIRLMRGETAVPWREVPAGSLRSGASYLFRFDREGYYPQSYNLAVDPYQTDLALKVSLIPLPGAVRIISSQPGLRLTLDGSPDYLRGGRNPVYERLGETTGAPRTLSLAPGEYTLTVARSAGRSHSVRLRVSSGGTLAVLVEVDRATGRIQLSVQE